MGWRSRPRLLECPKRWFVDKGWFRFKIKNQTEFPIFVTLTLEKRMLKVENIQPGKRVSAFSCNFFHVRSIFIGSSTSIWHIWFGLFYEAKLTKNG